MVEIMEKQSFAVIGKVGQGPANVGTAWIAPLWQEADRNFHEISSLAKVDSDGNIVGIWGAMSDVDEHFERWQDEGKYLAGCEVADHAIAPSGWTKWVIPAYKYAVVSCTQDTYNETFHRMLSEYMPAHAYKLAGAVQEFYNPKANQGELALYFPIERIESV